jgi:anti-sigma regulatory factor (Ser/Thr protein kinase)
MSGQRQPPSMAESSARDYWLAQLAGWGGLGLVMIFTSISDTREGAIRFALVKLFCMCTGCALSHGWRLFLKRRRWFERKESFPIGGVVAGLLLLSLVQLGFLMLGERIFGRESVFKGEEYIIPLFLSLMMLWFIMFLVWTLIYAVAQARRRTMRVELEKLQLEVSIKDAELRALQAQVNPHFFFNSLNSIRALVFHDPKAAARAIGQLGDMMRHSLKAGQSDTVRLADELKAVDAYLSMEKLRFEQRLRIAYQIDAGLDDTAMPPMVLQTLVENAVKHGVERRVDGCEIRIGAQRQPQAVEITIANQGHIAVASDSTRLGLQNAGARLALLFGERASCTLQEQDGWVVARVVIPDGRENRT